MFGRNAEFIHSSADVLDNALANEFVHDAPSCMPCFNGWLYCIESLRLDKVLISAK
jgi:Pyruvate/2-oxoacid:ferredoxin oxidoreductase delta subunit